MKNIVFKKLAIKNFLSVGDVPVVIDFKTGLNIITGANKDKDDSRNGVGKSTIADAIFFGVFGSTLRDIKKENISNDSFKGSCEIQLYLDIVTTTETIDIHITRSLDPSRVILEVNGMDKTLDSIANTNESIAQLLNCNPEVFENCVIMTLNNALPFMCRKKQDKRKFIESIFNLEVFGKMLAKVKTDYSDQKNKLDVETARLLQVDNVINGLKGQERAVQKEKQIKIAIIESLKSTAKQKRDKLVEQQSKLDPAKLTADKAQCEANIKAIEDAKPVLNQSLTEYTEKKTNITNSLNAQTIQSAQIASDIRHLNAQLQKINSSEPTCPVCLHVITADDKAHIEQERSKLGQTVSEKQTALTISTDAEKLFRKQIQETQTQITDITGRTERAEALKREMQGKIALINGNESLLNKIQQGIELIDAEIKGYDDNLANIGDSAVSFASAIAEQETILKEIAKGVNTIKGKIALLDKVKFVFSEEGVKSYLVKQILDLFNNRMAYYLQKMDANCISTFNEYFEETIFNDKGKPFSYYNFSGAERKKIDLACLFTFMDIRRLQGDVSFNISVYDELLDSSLDAKGVESVVNILKERVEKYNECMYIISHRKESTKLATGEVIYLQKNNGITTRVDFQLSPV